MKTTITFVVCILGFCDAYKILLIIPSPGSHFILGNGILKLLVEAGHEVTFITSSIPETSHPNVTFVDASVNRNPSPPFGAGNIVCSEIYYLKNGTNKENKDGVMNIENVMKKKNKYDFFHFLPALLEQSKNTVGHRNVQKLLGDKTQHFDLCIAEYMFNEAHAGFAGVYNCPLIWLSTVETHWMILELVDEIPNPAYNVDIMSNGVPPLTFTERIRELYRQIYATYVRKFYANKMLNEIYEKYFVPHIRHRPIPSFESLMYNASLVLSNSHVSMGIATRLPPNFISIGGYHIDVNVKPLPEDLQSIMDNAKHGVIYFSMGSNLRSKHFPKIVKQQLFKTFSEFNQTVVWKFEEDLPNRPNNVHILNWAPQQSILAHKNCILFITHGGLLSTTETIHFGVPIIAIPVFADQFINAERSESKGFAIKIELSYSLADDLKVAIQEMLYNTSYTEKVKDLSSIYHDRAIQPAKELVHWVEHVVKTKGALHLRSPALFMPWYQKCYVDFIFVLQLVVISIKYIVFYIFNVFKRRIFFCIEKKIN